jgi:hypothetical protein
MYLCVSMCVFDSYAAFTHVVRRGAMAIREVGPRDLDLSGARRMFGENFKAFWDVNQV